MKGMSRMKSYNKRLTNPVKLADNTIFALSSIERGNKVSPVLLREGIELCNYLISLLKELKISKEKKTQLIFSASNNDYKALQEIDIDKVRKTKKWIEDLVKNPLSHTKEEINDLRKFLITVTMPMWQNRTLEFREMKLKQGLIIRG